MAGPGAVVILCVANRLQLLRYGPRCSKVQQYATIALAGAGAGTSAVFGSLINSAARYPSLTNQHSDNVDSLDWMD